jgi:uncharacterized membrane protein (DUF4010 family)
MPVPSLAHVAVLLGLSFFFGLAFEEFYSGAEDKPPGGIRTFPLLAIGGGALYWLDPKQYLPLTAGILVLGVWLLAYYRHELAKPPTAGEGRGALLVPACNLLAFLLGPLALAAPPWLAIGTGIAAVLLLTARDRLHALARHVDTPEIITAAEFLLLTGLILPLLPDRPVTGLTSITPYKAWLALLAVCSISYLSYLIRKHLAPKDSDLWVAVLGGLYSSTATTVVLARGAAQEKATLPRARAGITLATALMYLRLLIVVAIFNRGLALNLAPRLVGLAVLGGLIAAVQYRLAGKPVAGDLANEKPRNPLALGSAAIFAALFVIVSILAAAVERRYGQAGIEVLAAVVGVTDIDPFVLSLAQGAAAQITPSGAAAAILVASASNNVLKAGYATLFAGFRASLAASAALVGLGVVAVILGIIS